MLALVNKVQVGGGGMGCWSKCQKQLNVLNGFYLSWNVLEFLMIKIVISRGSKYQNSFSCQFR